MLKMARPLGFASLVLGCLLALRPALANEGLIHLHVKPLDEATNRLDAAEVVILCILDEYTSRPRSPASVLNHRLSLISDLADAVGRVAIRVVECGLEGQSGSPRAVAQSLFRQWDVAATYDMTIPVIFIFHEGVLFDVTTYRSKTVHCPSVAIRLREIVLERLDAKGVVNAIRAGKSEM